MVYYVSVQVIIDAPSLVEVIIDVVVRHYGLSDSIITNQELLFTSKFWLLLCYFLDIKQKLSTAFYPQIDDQIVRQNSSIEVYLWVFVNFKQNDCAWLLLIAEFTYNNAKNASTCYMPFEFNCGYHL